MWKKTQKKKKEKVKILGISAGPALASRSELLLNSLLDEFLKSGCKISKVIIRGLSISFCEGCNNCEKIGRCKWKDDMQILENELLSSDIVVVSSPIYFTSLPAKLKAVIDRCQHYWVKKKQGKFDTKHKKGLFVSVAGGEGNFKHAEVIVKAFFSIFNINFSGKFYLPNTDRINNKQFKKAIKDVKKLTKGVVV